MMKWPRCCCLGSLAARYLSKDSPRPLTTSLPLDKCLQWQALSGTEHCAVV